MTIRRRAVTHTLTAVAVGGALGTAFVIVGLIFGPDPTASF